MSQRKLRVGMVGGGGPANFFGAPHRRAILMDNAAELTDGALRSNPEEAIASAKELYFTRGYGDWKHLIEAESKPQGQQDQAATDAARKQMADTEAAIAASEATMHRTR